MRYEHFNASLYCPVMNLMDMTDFDDFEERFQIIEKNVKLSKVYLETYRSGITISKEQMLKVMDFFKGKGIAVAGGITTNDVDNPKEGGFTQLCYTQEESKERLKNVVALTAQLFDEFILDDFFFTNCRCDDCISAKGSKSWADFRLELMIEISKDIIIKTAKDVNPKVKIIIKYPNWYEHYQESGYNLKDHSLLYDYIYTGTETRNPTYTQQHLPKYLSYFIMRYLENVAPNRNLGGWFDTFECSYNLTSYLDQGYLTLFAKAKEAMLFCLGLFTHTKDYSTFGPAIGQAFEDVDQFYDLIDNPLGVSSYIPYHSFGEDYLHNYLGMCGIPLEPYPNYPEDARTIFLTESAASDPDILGKIKKSLHHGGDLIVTSGFVSKLGDSFHDLVHVSYTGRKSLINQYMTSTDGGVTLGECYGAAKKILLSQPQFFTNDVWQIAGGYGEDNNCPILMKAQYSKGRLFILTIPDDQGDLYHYPVPILNILRNILSKDLPLYLEGNPKVTLFLYDNDTFILRSFLPYFSEVNIMVKKENAILSNLITHRDLIGSTISNGRSLESKFTLRLAPGVNYLFKIKKQS